MCTKNFKKKVVGGAWPKGGGKTPNFMVTLFYFKKMIHISIKYKAEFLILLLI